jgi:hypothetical protein
VRPPKLPAVVAGVILTAGAATLTGVPGRADAAAPTTVTRFVRNISMTVKLSGGGIDATCTGAPRPNADSVTTSLGQSRSTHPALFSCQDKTSDNLVRVYMSVTNTWRSDTWATSSYSFKMVTVAVDGKENAACRTWTVASNQVGFVTSPFGATWAAGNRTTSASNTCTRNVFVTVNATWQEGWSAP